MHSTVPQGWVLRTGELRGMAPGELKVKSYGAEIPVGLGGGCLLCRSFQEHDFGLRCLKFPLRIQKLFSSQLMQAKYPRQLVHWGNKVGKSQ